MTERKQGRFRPLKNETPGDAWQTPDHVLAAIKAVVFGGKEIQLDPCASKNNARRCAKRGLIKGGLLAEWKGRVFVNPPYSDLEPWVAKARESAAAGARVAMLIPFTPDTRLWHSCILGVAVRVYAVGGRIKFLDAGLKPSKGSPFQPSAVVVFDGANKRGRQDLCSLPVRDWDCD